MTVPCSKGSLADIPILYSYPVISLSKIYLRKYFRTLQLIKKIIDSQQMILVLDSYLVQLSEINAQLQRPILLLHEQDQGTPR
jgi:hypothetical protein